MKTASVVFSLLGFAAVLLPYITIAHYAFDPQQANLLATNPGIYGIGVGYALIVMLFVGYPLCLAGAGFAFGAAWRRRRYRLAALPPVVSVLGILIGCLVAFSIGDQVETTAAILLGLPFAIPVTSIAVVSILSPRLPPITSRDLPLLERASDGLHQRNDGGS